MRAPAVMAPSPEKKTMKRRGRPPKSGGKSQLALLGGCSPGNAFAPHVLHINQGEGHFEIISLKGSYLLSDEGDSGNHGGGLSIVVSTPCGTIFGGSIGGPLIAADPVQVIAGSFNYMVTEEKKEPKTSDSQLTELKVPWELDSEPYEPFSPLPHFGWSRIEDVKFERHGFDLTNG